MDGKLIVSSSPHISSPVKTKNIMLDVIIALIPSLIASIYFFGPRAAVVVIASVATCVIAEYICRKVMKREQTIGDLSAVVTGILLAFNLPSSVPIYVPIIGGLVAIVMVKQMFGGLGHNFANPAITARIFLLLSFSGTMTAAVFPQNADVVSGATPLGVLSGQEGTLPTYLDLFLGKCGGALGETCALALLVGGIYLVIRGVITWHTPVVFIATVFLFSLVLGQDPVAEILSGGLFIGAIFMATDYATTPNTAWGKVIFGVGCGLITVLIRVFGSYPEGVSFSILLMNILTPYIERWTRTKPFGGAKA